MQSTIHYLLNLAIAVDQLLNALLWGMPDETLSSRAFRADRDGKVFGRFFRPVIDTIFFWQDRHCYQSYLAEVQRRQYPRNFR
jgi:hypothetical protein